jgi:hypothetical protein
MRSWAICSAMDRWMVALGTALRKAGGRAREVDCARLEMVAVGPTERARRDHACGAHIRPSKGALGGEAAIPLRAC